MAAGRNEVPYIYMKNLNRLHLATVRNAFENVADAPGGVDGDRFPAVELRVVPVQL